MHVVLICAFALSLALSLVFTGLMRRVALRVGFVDRPRVERHHTRVTPFGGGVAIVAATSLVVFAVAAAAWLARQHPELLPVPTSLAEDAARAAERMPLVLYILGGGLGIAFFGLWDDIRPLGSAVKLLAQIVIISTLVISSGIRISAFVAVDWIQAAITIAWLVLLTNSFNLLDNMDGLSGTVGFICAGALLIVALQTTQFFIAGVVLVLMGAVLGFLFYNFPPAAIFMGDTGSMFIGYMLGTVTALSTFLIGPHANRLFPVLVPPIIFAVPLYDTVSVVLIRLHHKRPVMQGDRNHFSHRIHRLGMSTRRVLVTVAMLALATSLGATIPYGSPTWQALAPAVQALAACAVIAALELASGKVDYPDAGSMPTASRDEDEPA